MLNPTSEEIREYILGFVTDCLDGAGLYVTDEDELRETLEDFDFDVLRSMFEKKEN